MRELCIVFRALCADYGVSWAHNFLKIHTDKMSIRVKDIKCAGEGVALLTY